MYIGGVDIKTTKKLKRKAIETGKEMPVADADSEPVTNAVAATFELSSSESSEPENCDEDFSCPSTSTSSHKKLKYTALATACDRTGVSDRSAALIASAVLEDAGVIDETEAVDRSKLRRERKSRRQYLQDLGIEKLEALYFDGRKDKTKIIEKLGDRNYTKSIVEEHISLVCQPGSKYIGHVVPSSGSAQNISSAILAYFKENSVDLENLVAIGCDGTAVNTGNRGGVIRLLEQHLCRPLQWLICQLHSNELTLRHLLEKLDGHTTGPYSYSGPVGKKLEECEKLPVVKFKPILAANAKPSITNKSELSKDQDYLLRICEAVKSGSCPEALANKNPGKLSHARWLTAGNRILRLYISTEDPDENLKTLAEFVVKVYAPMWFTIRCQPMCVNGPENIMKTIRLSRYNKEVTKIVDPVIQRNSFFAQPESILVAMLVDDRPHIRQLALRRIIKARSTLTTSCNTNLRTFWIPLLNFAAEDYIDLTSWQDCDVTEPPLTMNLTIEQLQTIARMDNPDRQLFLYPTHTQAVERTVKIVTEVSQMVCGFDARHGMILTKLHSGEIMSTLQSKSDYTSHAE